MATVTAEETLKQQGFEVLETFPADETGETWHIVRTPYGIHVLMLAQQPDLWHMFYHEAFYGSGRNPLQSMTRLLREIADDPAQAERLCDLVAIAPRHLFDDFSSLWVARDQCETPVFTKDIEEAVDELEGMVRSGARRRRIKAGERQKIFAGEFDEGICTHSANMLAWELGGVVAGYYVPDIPEDEPQPLMGDCMGGHDFVLLGDHRIVDWWGWKYYPERMPGRPWLDLGDPDDRALAWEFYGDPKNWERRVPTNPYEEQFG